MTAAATPVNTKRARTAGHTDRRVAFRCDVIVDPCKMPLQNGELLKKFVTNLLN